jgi:hypothetical protein
MRGPEVRAARLRGEVLLVLLVPVLAGAFGQPLTAVIALGALTLVCGAFPVLVPIPAGEPTGVAVARLRAWGRAQSEIRRAEEPDRPGRARPRAPGAARAALEH